MHCDPSDCEVTDISCIEGWWNHVPSGYHDGLAWLFYDDFYDCVEEDYSLNSCGGERGMRMFGGTGSTGFCHPTTDNPFFGFNPLAAYQIQCQLNIIDKTSGGVRVEIWVDDSATAQTSPTSHYVGTSQVVTALDYCYDLKIAITDPPKVLDLVTHPFLIFVVKPELGPSPPISVHTVEAVLDNPSACVLLDIELSRFKCDNICVNTTTDCPSECTIDRAYDIELDDCYIQVVWFEDEEYTEEILECYSPYIGTTECCFTPSEPGTYYGIVSVLFQINGEPVVATHYIEVEHEPCSTVVISTNTTWDGTDLSDATRFETITVQSGFTLTIEDDLTVRFCEDGKLIIQPGGTVMLNGTLTAACNVGWEGVEVQGNGSTNQYPQSGVYPQGRLFCNPGSRIEHARIGARLYGPDYSDAGGQVFADGASFVNNSRGLDFAPFHNYFSTIDKQKFYNASIRNCVFEVDESYVYPGAFTHHIRLDGVFGIGIYGTYFGNTRQIPDNNDPRVYGVGVMSVNSQFTVGSSAVMQSSEPCLPGDCTIFQRSRFDGLCIGVFAGRTMRNRPFQVYDSEFRRCFFGISNEGVSGANILFNDFLMGEIKELKFDENQVGVSLSGYQQIGAIQENTFVHSPGNADYTIGIVSRNIGEMDNVIRRNTFDGLHIGNEAFEMNAIFSEFYSEGLRLLCNENMNVHDKDFYVRDTEGYDVIHRWQAENVDGVWVAAGNTFSGTGDPDDGYYANYGDESINYVYDENYADQIPDVDAIVGVTTYPSGEADCDPLFCLHPCASAGVIGDVISRYYDQKADFIVAVGNEDHDLASYHQIVMDSCLNHIVRYHEYDTASFDLDTMRIWYQRMKSISGYLMLSGDYLQMQEFSDAADIIDSIYTHFVLNADQITDIGRVERLTEILSARMPDAYTSADIDTLRLYASGFGGSFSLARSALSLLDSLFTPRYYIPNEIEPRSVASSSSSIFSLPFKKIALSPNPVSAILNIEVLEPEFRGDRYRILDVNSRIVQQGNLEMMNGENTVRIDRKLISGLYILQVLSLDGRFISEKFVISNGQ